jgi:hypothetical protein
MVHPLAREAFIVFGPLPERNPRAARLSPARDRCKMPARNLPGGVVVISFDFGGRAAVVTGAGGGMGLAIARSIRAAGGAVLGIDMKARPAALDPDDARLSYARGDLTDADFVARSIDAAAAKT